MPEPVISCILGKPIPGSSERKEGRGRAFWQIQVGSDYSDIASGGAIYKPSAQMTITRFSLNDTSDGKHRLFLAAYERFRERIEAEQIRDLENADSGLAGIREFFRSVEQSISDEDDEIGCLLTNSFVERAVHDRDTRAWAQLFLGRLEAAFCSAIQKAIDAGEIPPTKRPRDLARYLICLLRGINVIGKTAAGSDEVGHIIRLALAQLG